MIQFSISTQFKFKYTDYFFKWNSSNLDNSVYYKFTKSTNFVCTQLNVKIVLY